MVSVLLGSMHTTFYKQIDNAHIMNTRCLRVFCVNKLKRRSIGSLYVYHVYVLCAYSTRIDWQKHKYKCVTSMWENRTARRTRVSSALKNQRPLHWPTAIFPHAGRRRGGAQCGERGGEPGAGERVAARAVAGTPHRARLANPHQPARPQATHIYK